MKLLWTLVFALFVSGCNKCADLDKEKIKEEFSKELHVGDSRKKVVHVLIKSGMNFIYDEYSDAYSLTIRGKDCAFDKSVLVDIYLDKSGSMSKIETSYAYTFL